MLCCSNGRKSMSASAFGNPLCGKANHQNITMKTFFLLCCFELQQSARAWREAKVFWAPTITFVQSYLQPTGWDSGAGRTSEQRYVRSDDVTKTQLYSFSPPAVSGMSSIGLLHFNLLFRTHHSVLLVSPKPVCHLTNPRRQSCHCSNYLRRSWRFCLRVFRVHSTKQQGSGAESLKGL